MNLLATMQCDVLWLVANKHKQAQLWTNVVRQCLSMLLFTFYVTMHSAWVVCLCQYIIICYLHHATTVLRPFFRDHPGEPVPEENFWTLWCKGRLTQADTQTTPSGLTSAHLHHPPIFYRPDALPAAQPTVSKHWRQLSVYYHFLSTSKPVMSVIKWILCMKHIIDHDQCISVKPIHMYLTFVLCS